MKKLSSILLMFVFALFLPLTWFNPRNNMDDYSYAFSYAERGKYLETFQDFISSMIAHYTERHGRIWANGLASVFSANDFDWIFKILNACAFTALIYLSVKVLEYNTKKTISWVSYAMTALLFWFLTPVPGETLLWMCGSLNYLWPSVYILLLVYLIKKSFKERLRFFPWIVLFAVLTGWQNEAFSAPLIGSFFIFYLLKRPHLSRQAIFMIGGFIIGSLFLIFSPGTIDRAGNSLLSTNSIILAILFRIYTFGMLFIGFRIKATMLVMVLLFFLHWKNKEVYKQFIRKNLLLVLTIGCSVAFMVVVAYVEDRGLMGIELFSILLLYRLIQTLVGIYPYNRPSFIQTIGLVILGIIFICDYSGALRSIYKFYVGDKQIMSDYIHSEDGLVCSPFEQADYDNRFAFYCNTVVFQKGLTMYFNYHLNEWKPFHLIPKSFYEAIKGDSCFFVDKNKVLRSDDFYSHDDELFYLTKINPTKRSINIIREYRFQPNSFLKKYLPKISSKIEDFYSHTNINYTLIRTNSGNYLFVNKLKRMLPGLEISKFYVK